MEREEERVANYGVRNEDRVSEKGRNTSSDNFRKMEKIVLEES